MPLLLGACGPSRLSRGRAAIASGDYAHGIEELKDDYRVGCESTTLREIASAYESAGDLGAAIAFYRLYRRTAPSDASAVDEAIAALTERLRECSARRACEGVIPAADVDLCQDLARDRT